MAKQLFYCEALSHRQEKFTQLGKRGQAISSNKISAYL
jgi:hypothetical protein